MSSAAEQEAVQDPAGRAVEPGRPPGRAAPVTVRTEITESGGIAAGTGIAAATEAVRAAPRAPVVWPGAPMPLGA
ncbi:hypothetical protein ACFWBZ_33185, partial [Streptomyces griseus]